MNNLKEITLYEQLKFLWKSFNSRRKKQFYALLVLMVFASLAEMIGIASVVPFFAALISPEQVYHHPYAQPFIKILEITDPQSLPLPLAIFFAIIILLAGIIRITLLYGITRFSFALGSDLSVNIYRRTLYQDYSIHVNRNSSEVISAIISKTNGVVGGVISPILRFISSIIIFIGIVSVLINFSPVISMWVVASFGTIYITIIYYSKPRIEKNSKIIANNSTQMIKYLQEGLGGIRDIIMNHDQQFYCKKFTSADLLLRRAGGNNSFISQSPRLVVEMLTMIIVSILAYVMLQQDGTTLSSGIPLLAAFALGGQKLIPAIQQLYSSYSSVKGSRASLEDVLIMLDQPLPKSFDNKQLTVIPFEKEIRLTSLGFRHLRSKDWILKDINIVIEKGTCVGFVGVTGSGKSTLLDVIMGLLLATEGELTIDKVKVTRNNLNEWQSHIAHVPQNIYLSDGSVEENIAFGIPVELINFQKVKKAAKQALISDSIDQWVDGYKTLVGEGGIRLSGGQRQRIGIARALYREADVLILDEATSALDDDTEESVMKSIYNFDKKLTILIIAHRLKTLKGCDKIINLENESKNI